MKAVGWRHEWRRASLYLWLVVVTGVRCGELCGVQIHDIDLDRGLVHVAFSYVVRGGRRVRKDTKTPRTGGWPSTRTRSGA